MLASTLAESPLLRMNLQIAARTAVFLRFVWAALFWSITD
jgi:hypothetical protein